MAKFYCMGNYTAQAFQGFLKDPTSDRSKLHELLVKPSELSLSHMMH